MSKCVIILVCVAINIILLGGYALLIAWLADKTKSPIISIEHGEINNYNFTANNLFNATVTLIVRSYNPDPKHTIILHVLAVSMYHNRDYALGFETLGPYSLDHGDGIEFIARHVSQDVRVSVDGVAETLRNESRVGELRLDVVVRGHVRYEVKGWKHKHFILKAICSPIVFNLISRKTFRRSICDVKRHI